VSIPVRDLPDVLSLLDAARHGDQAAFGSLTEPHRRPLQVHCYRMLGSLHDAEDLVQETLLRAWRGIDRFEGRASFRSWLYRIATNACLNAIASRRGASRVLPEAYGPPAQSAPVGTIEPPSTEIAWLEPYPDALLEGIPDSAPGPDARYDLHESVQLAFVAAIQHLPPRQRAVLLLRDVLGWSANEAAELLDGSVASVNSALQRARATLAKRLPTEELDSLAAPDEGQRALLDRYVQAWEMTDLDGLVALLREEAVLSMPPHALWYSGAAAIRGLLAWAWRARGPGDVRIVPIAANRQPAYAQYHRDAEKEEWHAHSIWLPSLKGGAIVALHGFISPDPFPAFELPIAEALAGNPPGSLQAPSLQAPSLQAR
jgi:RNA polymerase sigma-70 factor (ECF subfamily)